VAKGQAPVEKRLHLGSHIRKIDRRGHYDPIGCQNPFHDSFMVIVYPASSLFQAKGAARAILDFVI
jgi:hypothetical protein